MKFEFNEYVWDRVWGGPAIVVSINERPGVSRPYVVGEITRANKSLGRTAARSEGGLCRYVSVKIPEDEALLLIRGFEADEEEETWHRGQDRIREGLELRGIPIVEEKT